MKTPFIISPAADLACNLTPDIGNNLLISTLSCVPFMSGRGLLCVIHRYIQMQFSGALEDKKALK